ncbi:MAG: LacI family DNA-binding transcriptional regulator [Devosia sp.]|nr:LacI family DNA-binding transcriptional regulator [Devosia sp.]
MATIHDVALSAGVSPTTVSRYVNNRIDLPAPTAARIDAAIAALDYRPNLLAKRLSTGKSEAIGLVTPEIGNPFFAELAAAVEDEAERHGYAVFMSSTRGDVTREIASLNRLNDRHVDGLILMTNRPDDGKLAALIEPGRPVVLIDEDVPGVEVPRIFVENEQGTYLATRHLIDEGHRSIGMVGGARGLLTVEERWRGFERAMRERQLPIRPEHLLFGAYSREFGRAATAAIIGTPAPPTAIIAASDYIAIGVIQALRDAGLGAPRDMSIVGFDDMPFAELMDPALTTIRQPVAAMGRLGFQALLGLMTGTPVEPLTRLPVQLIKRNSVGRPRQGAINS